MATDEELLEATKYSMEKSGFLAKIRGELNCEIMNILGVSEMRDLPKPEVPFEIKLVNDLVKEYLSWIGYCYTSCVMSAESHTPDEGPMSRPQMEEQLGVETTQDASNLPLLYCLIKNLRTVNQVPLN